MKRRLVWLAAFIVGLPTLVLVAAVAVSSTSRGEDRFRELVVDAVSGAIPGTVTIDRLADISLLSPPGHVSASVWGVQFKSGTRPVIELDHARVTHSWLALLGGEVRIEEAEVVGGTVTVELTEDGGLYLVRAFDAPSTGAAGARAEPIPIALENLRTEQLNVLVRLPGQLVHLTQVSGRVDVTRRTEAPQVVVRLTDVKGVVSRPNVLGSKLRLEQTSGTLGGAGPAVVDLALRGEFMSSPVSGELRYLPAEKPGVQIVIRPQGAAAQLVANVTNLETMFGNNVRIEVR